MKIYALGNALMDTVIEDSGDLIDQFKLEKGSMTLIDDSQLQNMLPHIQPHITEKSAGGSAANTCITAQLMGANCQLSCKVANDENGQLFIKDLDTLQLQHNYTQQTPETGTTGTCLVFVTPDAERTMSTYLGISATYGPDDVQEADIQAADLCYIEGYLVSTPEGVAAAQKACTIAKGAGKKIGFTCSDINMIRFFGEQMATLLKFQPDYLFCNEQEALSLTQTNTLTDATQALSQIAHTSILTKGSQGASIITPTQTIDIPAYPAQAIDTNGAGDTFAGAFLAGVAAQNSLEAAGHLASLAAAKIVSKVGPRLSAADISSLTPQTHSTH